MATFDPATAKAAGYTDAEIAGIQKGLAEGYTLEEIDQFLGARPQVGVGQGERPPTGQMGLTKAAGAGAAEGVISNMGGFVGDFAQMRKGVQKAVGESPDSINNLFYKFSLLGAAGSVAPTTQQLMRGMGIDYEAKSTPEKFAKSAASSAASLGMGPAKGMVERLLLGAGLGVSGEAGAQALGDDSPIGRIFGQLPIAALAGYLVGKKPQVVKAAGDYASEVGPEGLAAASG